MQVSRRTLQIEPFHLQHSFFIRFPAVLSISHPKRMCAIPGRAGDRKDEGDQGDVRDPR